MFCKKSVQEITSKWESEKPILEAEEQIRLEKENILKNKKTSTTTKRLMQYIFLDCTIIQIFTGYLRSWTGILGNSITEMKVHSNIFH